MGNGLGEEDRCVNPHAAVFCQQTYAEHIRKMSMTNFSLLVLFQNLFRKNNIFCKVCLVKKNDIMSVCVFTNAINTSFYNIRGGIFAGPPEYPNSFRIFLLREIRFIILVLFDNIAAQILQVADDILIFLFICL